MAWSSGITQHFRTRALQSCCRSSIVHALTLTFIIFNFSWAQAASSNEKVVIQGRILDASNVPVTNNNVTFDISVYSPTTGIAGSHCLLYEETQTIDMSASNGTFVVQLGSGSRVGTGPTLREAFTNASVASFGSLTCGVGSAYTPGSIDDRNIEMTVSFGATNLTLASIPVKAVPYAFQANQIGGYSVSNLVRLNGAGSNTNLNVDQFNYLTGFFHDNNTSGNFSDDYLDAQSLQIKNLAAPTAGTDAATKTYVDTAVSGVSATLPALTSANIWVGNGSNVATAVAASGDVTLSNAGAFKVTALQNVAVSSTAPTSNQVLQYDGTKWAPATITTDPTGASLTSAKIWVGNASNLAAPVSASGDVTLSNAGAFKVTALQNVAVDTTAPTSSQVLQYDGTKWAPATLSATLPSLADTKIWVGNGSNVATAVSMSGDATIANTGALTLNTVPVTKGGTGVTSYTSGQVPVYDGTKLTGMGCSAGQTLVWSAGTGFGCGLPSASGGTLASANIWVGNGSNIATAVAASGDVTLSNAGAFKVTALQNVGVSSTAPTSNQVLQYNGTNWVPATLSATLPSLTDSKIWIGNASNVATAVSTSGDVTLSNAGAFKVTALQNVGVSSTAPTSNQVLQYNGTNWVPATLAASLSPTLTSAHIFVGNGSNVASDVALSGDATITNAGALKVTALQNVGVSSTAPTSNQVLQYNGTNWVPATLTTGTVISGGTTKVLTMFNATGDNVINSSVTDNGASGVNFANSKIQFGGSLFLYKPGTSNLFLGTSAGNTSLTGSENIGIGANTLTSLTTGTDNTALGVGALNAMAYGNSNTALGAYSLYVEQGNDNTVIGYQALKSSTTAYRNVAIGESALINNLSGDNNTAIGTGVLLGAQGSASNVAIGKDALNVLVTGTNNVVMGTSAAAKMNSNSSSNVIIGYNAGPATLGAYSNKLFINNSESNTPLIGGDFSSGFVQLNSQLELPLSVTTPTPTAGYGRIYAKVDGNLYFKNGTTEYQLNGGSGYQSNSLTNGSIWVGNGSNIAAAVAPSGDLTLSNAGAFKVTALQNVGVSSTAPTSNQVLQYNGTSWVPATLSTLSPTLTSAHIFVGNGSNVASDVAMSGDATISNTGALTLNTVPVTKGGTGVTSYTTGQVPVYDGTKLTGMGCSSGQTLVWSAGTGFGCGMQSASGSSLASANIWVGNGSGIATAVAPSGDVSVDNTGKFTVTQLQGRGVASTAPSTNQVLTWNGSSWTPSGGSLTGGTASYLAKWTSATAVSTSVIYDDGTNVGVGTTSPVAMINAHGGSIVSDTQTNASGVTNIVFSTGNVQTSANSTSNAAFKICGMKDGGSYTLVLTAQPVGSLPTFTAYSDAACSTSIANFDTGGVTIQTTSATTIITFIRAGSTVYAMLATGFTL